MPIAGKHLRVVVLLGTAGLCVVAAPFVGDILRHTEEPGAPLVSDAASTAALAQEGAQPAEQPGPVAKHPVSSRTAPAKKAAARLDKTPPASPPQTAASTSTPTPTPAAADNQPITFQHAVNAKIDRCAPLIHDAASFTTGLPRASAMSTWSKDQPDDHMFQSIMGLGYESPLGPKAAAVLVATPDQGGCEAALVQVHPTTRSCEEIQGNLSKAGATFADLSGLAVTAGENAPRQVLLPAPSGGCVVVGVVMERRAK